MYLPSSIPILDYLRCLIRCSIRVVASIPNLHQCSYVKNPETLRERVTVHPVIGKVSFWVHATYGEHLALAYYDAGATGAACIRSIV